MRSDDIYHKAICLVIGSYRWCSGLVDHYRSYQYEIVLHPKRPGSALRDESSSGICRTFLTWSSAASGFSKKAFTALLRSSL